MSVPREQDALKREIEALRGLLAESRPFIAHPDINVLRDIDAALAGQPPSDRVAIAKAEGK